MTQLRFVSNAGMALNGLRLDGQKGQLGHGDLITRNVPAIVKGLSGKKIVTGGIWQPCTVPRGILHLHYIPKTWQSSDKDPRVLGQYHTA